MSFGAFTGGFGAPATAATRQFGNPFAIQQTAGPGSQSGPAMFLGPQRRINPFVMQPPLSVSAARGRMASAPSNVVLQTRAPLFSAGVPPRRSTPSRSTSALRQRQQQAQAILPAPPGVEGYFYRGAPLTEQQRKRCRCQLHIMGRNKPECYSTPGALGEGRCYNPYAVCAYLGGQPECSRYYAFTPQEYVGGIPTDEMEGYALSRHIPVGQTRQETYASIMKFLREKGEQ